MNGPANGDAPPIHVRHADLQRNGESRFRSDCPVCKEGVLPVRRNEIDFTLKAEDRCLLCGQAFVYDDIAELQKLEDID